MNSQQEWQEADSAIDTVIRRLRRLPVTSLLELLDAADALLLSERLDAGDVSRLAATVPAAGSRR